jgi:hypothetical protein
VNPYNRRANSLGPRGYAWDQVPFFHATLSANQNNVTGNATYATMICDNELADVGGWYNAATGIATAPVAGVYDFGAGVGLDQLGAGSRIEILLLLTARTLYGHYAATAGVSGFAARTFKWPSIRLAANDTARIQVMVTGIGADTADIFGSASPHYSFFGGRLVG